MKKSNVMIIVLSCMCLVLAASSIASADDAGTAANQLSSELRQSGALTRQEANSIMSSLKNMINKGAGKEDLKRAVRDLSNKGIRGNDLRDSVNSMNDLVNKGENPKEAGNLVSQAAAQAHADGLKGKDLAAKVHEAVKQMQADKRASIKTNKEQKQTVNAGRGMGIGSGKSNSSVRAPGGNMGNMGKGHGQAKK